MSSLLTLVQEMEPEQKSRPRKWWNNGWLSLLVLLLLFFALFLIGKYSPTYEPNPVVEGRLLSEWTNDLKAPSGDDEPHSRAVGVLKSHRAEVTPILIHWLSEKNSFPEDIYYETMNILDGKSGQFLGPRLFYGGAYFNQLNAAWAFYYMGDRDPKIIAALKQVVRQYQGSRHWAGEVASRTIEKLED